MSGRDPLRTVLCERLGIETPVVQAPMAGGWTTPELVAAVSRAGGLGMLAAARLSAADLRSAVERVRSLTDRAFGVNFLLAPPESPIGDIEAVQAALDPTRRELGLPPGSREIELPPSEIQEQLAYALEEGVPVVSFAMGRPRDLARRARAAGAFVMAMVTSVADALAVAADGIDAIVAQGAEAGGHRSTFSGSPDDEGLVGTLPLVRHVVEAVDVPVIAAGGIVDGRGLVAVLALGAAGVQLGTRFLAARESGATDRARRRLLAAGSADTIVTRRLSGRPARAVRTSFLDALEEARVEPLAWPYQAAAAADIYCAAARIDDPDRMPLLAGQGLGLLREQGAADIVADIVREARATLVTLSGDGAS